MGRTGRHEHRFTRCELDEIEQERDQDPGVIGVGVEQRAQPHQRGVPPPRRALHGCDRGAQLRECDPTVRRREPQQPSDRRDTGVVAGGTDHLLQPAETVQLQRAQQFDGRCRRSEPAQGGEGRDRSEQLRLGEGIPEAAVSGGTWDAGTVLCCAASDRLHDAGVDLEGQRAGSRQDLQQERQPATEARRRRSAEQGQRLVHDRRVERRAAGCVKQQRRGRLVRAEPQLGFGPCCGEGACLERGDRDVGTPGVVLDLPLQA